MAAQPALRWSREAIWSTPHSAALASPSAFQSPLTIARKILVLDAGGLKLNAVFSGGVRIPRDKLRFSIYSGEEQANGERALILPDVKPDDIIRLNTGTYHIVSNYGSENATIRADLKVEAGKLTEATVEHKAAELTMKLVREAGGEALADTAWSVINPSGEVIKESVGAFASMVLAEGDYTVIAKNKDKLFQRDFKVVAGKNQDVEVFCPIKRHQRRASDGFRGFLSWRQRKYGIVKRFKQDLAIMQCANSDQGKTSPIVTGIAFSPKPPEFTHQQRQSQRQRKPADEMEQPAILTGKMNGHNRGAGRLDEFCREHFPWQIFGFAKHLVCCCNAACRKDDNRHALFQKPHGFMTGFHIQRQCIFGFVKGNRQRIRLHFLDFHQIIVDQNPERASQLFCKRQNGNAIANTKWMIGHQNQRPFGQILRRPLLGQTELNIDQFQHPPENTLASRHDIVAPDIVKVKIFVAPGKSLNRSDHHPFQRGCCGLA